MLIDEELVAIVKKIKKYFYFPQEIEYAIEKNKIYVISIKPLTTQIPEKERKSDQVKINQKVLAKGIPLNPGVVTGQARILRNQDYYQIRSGEIAVISQLNKTLYSRISKAKGVVVGAGLFMDCEKALYRKNIKIPTIIGVKNAINVLQNKSIITVNGISGEIYSGGLSY